MYKPLPIAAALLALAGCVDAPPPRRAAPPPERVVERAPPPAAPVPDTTVYFYPAQGQGPQQQDRDRYECNNWAVKQTGFDPSLPGVAPHQRVQVVAGPPPGAPIVAGAATGAVLGAIVSRPREAGEGALIGAAAGALLGAASQSSQREYQDRRSDAIQRREELRDSAALERRSAGFRRAMSACLEGRGYTVR
jgi:hypothetical protein